ncbi:MAG: efflux RND transporter periplasmic adaptor subunit [Candidatus Eisenbacteria bacterium]|nr:efflux RND transporter periplasmic adaptor subunit [Candidatus Eisenbacteria bacterium]
MTPTRTVAPGDREQALRRELQQAYEALTEITSRLLLANEVAEAALSGEDRATIAARFLTTAARGLEVRRAALFFAEGGAFSVGATHGLSSEAAEALGENEGDLDACQRAMDGGAPHVVDPEMLAPDALEAIAAAPGENGEGVTEETGDDEDAADEEAEEVEEGDAGDAEAEDEEDAEASEGAEGGETEAEDDEAAEPGAPSFAIYLPMRLEEEPIGVLALGERAGNLLFRHEDLLFVQYLLRQFALTLHRSTLIEEVQERLEEQSALLKVSREITSTLDLDAVLRSVVNTAAVVVENDRAEIALLKGPRLVLKTVSGMTRLDPDQTELFKLTAPLEYLRAHPYRLHIAAGDLEGAPRAAEEVFGGYFSGQQMRSFMALPLADEQSVLGFLCLESRQETWSLEPAEGDTLSILAAQATVAIRNATLYSEIPLRGMSLPVSRIRSRVADLGRRGRIAAAALAVAALAGLVLPIIPERTGGAAEVRPLRFQGARAVTEGVVARTLVQGGEEVAAGQPLAVVEDFDLAGRVADLTSRLEVARRDVASARLAGDVARWRAAELRVQGLAASLEIEQRRARGQTLVAPFAGQVLELDLAQRVGQHLDAGQSFCTIAALNTMAVDFDVPEERVGRVRVGDPVAVKVMTFPTRAFRGRVAEVGWNGHRDAHGRTHFTVRAQIDNAGRMLRPGMTGIAKASIGLRPGGLLLLDPLARAIQMAWPW